MDPGLYRPKDEVEAWLGRDPLPRAAEQLESARVEVLRTRAEEEVGRAMEDAHNSPMPDGTELATATRESA